MDPIDIGQGAKDAAGSAASGIGEELVKIGKTAIGQVLGKSPSVSASPAPPAGDVVDLKKKDDDFSEKAQAEVRAKINAIYAEYAAKRKREEEFKKRDEQLEEQEEKKMEEISATRPKQANDPAIAKTRAEVGRNFGAE